VSVRSPELPERGRLQIPIGSRRRRRPDQAALLGDHRAVGARNGHDAGQRSLERRPGRGDLGREADPERLARIEGLRGEEQSARRRRTHAIDEPRRPAPRRAQAHRSVTKREADVGLDDDLVASEDYLATAAVHVASDRREDWNGGGVDGVEAPSHREHRVGAFSGARQRSQLADVASGEEDVTP